VAAVVILALAVTFYFTFKTPKNLALAREVTEDCFEDHDRCDDSPAVPHHIYTSDHEGLGRSLTEKLDFSVEIPDLSAEGYRLVEGHSCEVIGRISVHAYYDGDSIEDRLSFFCVPRMVEEGVLGEPLRLLARRTRERDEHRDVAQRRGEALRSAGAYVKAGTGRHSGDLCVLRLIRLKLHGDPFFVRTFAPSSDVWPNNAGRREPK
jgi:hypothetical protein